MTVPTGAVYFLPMPSSDNNRAKTSFKTYKHYLLGYSYLLDLECPTYESISSRTVEVPRNTNADIGRITSLLFNAWNSEMLLNLPRHLSLDFIKFSNHWSPVQSYYGIYLSLRSLMIAKNMQTHGDHAATLQDCVSNLISGQKLIPAPWNILATADGYKNMTLETLPEINSQEDPSLFRKDRDKLVASVCMFIRTTRDRLVEDAVSEWKTQHSLANGNKRSNLPAGQRQEISAAVRDVSVFDALYRLRVRSNYKDADMFLLGSDSSQAQEYLNALTKITDKTLMMLEMYISRSMGKNAFKQACAEYLERTKTLITVTGSKRGIAARLEYI